MSAFPIFVFSVFSCFCLFHFSFFLLFFVFPFCLKICLFFRARDSNSLFRRTWTAPLHVTALHNLTKKPPKFHEKTLPVRIKTKSSRWEKERKQREILGSLSAILPPPFWAPPFTEKCILVCVCVFFILCFFMFFHFPSFGGWDFSPFFWRRRRGTFFIVVGKMFFFHVPFSRFFIWCFIFLYFCFFFIFLNFSFFSFLFLLLFCLFFFSSFFHFSFWRGLPPLLLPPKPHTSLRFGEGPSPNPEQV